MINTDGEKTEKNWWESKIIWSGVVTVAASVAGFFGIVVGQEVQADLANAVFSAVTAGTGIVTIISRITTTTKIKK